MPPGTTRHRTLARLRFGCLLLLGLLALSSAGTVGWSGALPELHTPDAPGSPSTPVVAPARAMTDPSARQVPTSSGPDISYTPSPDASVTAWSNLTNSSANPRGSSGPSPYVPAPRASPNLVFDAADGYDLLFGGVGGWVRATNGTYVPGHTALNDTWTFEDQVWRNISSSVGAVPPPGEESMAYDASDGYVVLYDWSAEVPVGPCGAYNLTTHTYDDDLANCTWEFHDGRWTQLTDPTPTGVGGPEGLTYDSRDGYVLAVGLYPHPWTFSFRDGVWTNETHGVQPDSVQAPLLSLSDDPPAGGAIFVGGSSTAGTQLTTWRYSEGNWTNLTASVGPSPSPRNGTTMANDPALDGAVLYGGHGGFALGPSLNETWVLGATGWTNETSALGRSPPPLAGAGLAWDPGEQELVLFGGIDYPYDTDASPASDQTWILSNESLPGSLQITATPDPADAGAPVNFQATFSGGVAPFSYAWAFGDGNGSALASPSHEYTSEEVYTVDLTVRDSRGSSTSAQSQVQIVAPLSVSVSIAPDPTEAGINTSFVATATSGSETVPNSTESTLTEVWSYGDGSFLEPGGLHPYEESGNFTVKLWVNDSGGGAYFDEWTLWVHPSLGTPVIHASSFSPVFGQVVNFSAAEFGGVSPYSYFWAFGDGSTGGDLPVISHVYTSNGPFTVQVTVTDALGIVARASLPLAVLLNVTILGEWSAGAAPLPITFDTTIHGGDPGYAYQWAFGDGGTSPLADPTHTFTTPGYYDPALTVTDAAGHTAQASWPVYIAVGGATLNVSLTASPATIPLGGYTVVTAAVSGGAGGYTFAWQGGTGACVLQGILSERCTGTTLGSYPLHLTLTGSQAGTGVASATIVVVEMAVISGPPPSPDWIAIAGPVALVAAVLVGALLLTRNIQTRGGRGGSGEDVNREYRLGAATTPATVENRPVKKGAVDSESPSADPMQDLV
ncbi:MAG: PKD domain-containing protein [Thermoplasmata archaeon]|nr:PKD domain-containing protein [Thermoplasmata archaeon]